MVQLECYYCQTKKARALLRNFTTIAISWPRTISCRLIINYILLKRDIFNWPKQSARFFFVVCVNSFKEKSYNTAFGKLILVTRVFETVL